ncbi:hypothetical protein DXG03_005406 [Asterophora parasitica]|uniref:Uncharacterized protein n=1 Tax=Asterophora parasitica TaxID=117018 RepID=A0A9P7G9F7_9AGAR|nr:hypothetical protein DXG03_005406 [Asterophora parasitica]
MRFSFATATILSVALSSLAAPLFVDEEGLELRWEDQDLELRWEDQSLDLRGWEDEGLALRWEDLDVRAPGDKKDKKKSNDWSTIPPEKKTKQVGRLNPQPGESSTHITYKQGGHKTKNPPVHTDQYEVWEPSAYKDGMTTGGRWRGNEGKTHGGIAPPIWHPPAGEVKGKKAYTAKESQNPPSYDQMKFSKSVKDQVNKMPSSGNPAKGKSRDDQSPSRGRKDDKRNTW